MANPVPVHTGNGSSVEALTQTIGREILADAQANAGGVFSSKFWSDKLMTWAMSDPELKVRLFRFVDVFPTLHSPQAIFEHLREYLDGVAVPAALQAGISAGAIAKGVFAKTIASQIEASASRFIAGESVAGALPRLRQLWDEGVGFSVDLLGEACVSDAEAAQYQRRYLELIDELPKWIAQWPAKPTLEHDHLGRIPRANVSIKISSLYARANPIDFDGSLNGLIRAIETLLAKAHDNGVFINFDMEHHALKDLTLTLFERCCEQFEFEGGIAMQAYLRSGEADAKRLIEWSRRTGKCVSVRLIKGAYWDFETIHAEQLGWPQPVWNRKSDSDACFERMTTMFVDAMPRSVGEPGVKLALGTHNARSIAHAVALLRDRGLPDESIELQMLHGMSDDLRSACIKRGLRVREYVPVGQLLPGMAYLVRRLLENTSNESWLRAGFRDHIDPAVLLAAPEPMLAPARQAVKVSGDGRPFINEPIRDFSDADQRGAFAQAIERSTVPDVRNDSTLAQATQAVEKAAGAFAQWRALGAKDRANTIVRAAAIMRQRRDSLAGVMIREAGKPWAEADADVCEAIDFCEYYARESVRLFTPQRMGHFLGEQNEQWHDPRGVAVVISPWNFPLAICTGMTVAALVTGNPTIVKPAEQTPGIAKLLVDVLHEAGVPRNVVQLVAGQGETVGAALVRDPRVAVIAFTGSQAVGLDIVKAAADVVAGQRHVKRVIAEMGGKNAIIVDASADLDEAVLGVARSAFSFAGQKCSACSRTVAVGKVYDTFLTRLIEATRTLVIGDPMKPGTDIGPLIDTDAARRVEQYIEIGKQEGILAFAGQVPDGLATAIGKPFVAPHIFTGIERQHRLASEEIFGPVLAVMRANDFEDAMAIANYTTQRLTGGVYSRTPSHIERARHEFRVGNLYVNRHITGALVGRQPFGGSGLSGVGSKAGGAEYLLQFVEPRVVSENTMRRGFAPGLE